MGEEGRKAIALGKYPSITAKSRDRLPASSPLQPFSFVFVAFLANGSQIPDSDMVERVTPSIRCEIGATALHPLLSQRDQSGQRPPPPRGQEKGMA